MGRSDQKGGVDRLRFGKVPSGHCVEDRREAGAEGRRLALHYCNLPGERWGGVAMVMEEVIRKMGFCQDALTDWMRERKRGVKDASKVLI